MKQDELVATNIRLPKTQLKALKREALRRDKSVNFLLRQMIERYLHRMFLETDEKEEKYEGILEVAKRISKKGLRGPRDLASNIDKYVYGTK